jgi:hypothetical protein
MKLDRNIAENHGRGKYALLLLRSVEQYRGGTFNSIRPDILAALKLLSDEHLLDFGDTPETEFFVMRLKDQFASHGLTAYANAAELVDYEYGQEVGALAKRSGKNNPFCKQPD